MIKQAYLAQLVQQGATPEKADELWLQLENAYAGPERFFHDLAHLEHLYKELYPLRNTFTDWPTALFSLCYHDVVYDVEQHAVSDDNEERSADVAESHLKMINYPAEKIQRCREQILATKHNSVHADNDTRLLTDADLCILGHPWNIYYRYKNQIRQEYGNYPDLIYHAGRKKLLLSFINRQPLFQTDHFGRLYEEKAKENMQKEIDLMQG
jgi:predicted metal-dependent HD superfamily phosphohydrolase